MTDRSKGIAQSDGTQETEDAPLPGALLHGPFSMNRREMVITGTGLYGRPSRGERIANMILSVVFGMACLIALITAAASLEWTVMLLSACGILVAILAWMSAFTVRQYRPILEIRGSRVIIGMRDYGPLDGAYLQPELKGKCAILLHTATAPYGVSVLQLVSRKDVGILYGLLIRHLPLDGSHSGDWPPRPERSVRDADRTA
jgi:hypothetical protein